MGSIANRAAGRPAVGLRTRALTALGAIRAQIDALERELRAAPAPVTGAAPRAATREHTRRLAHYQEIERANFRGTGPVLGGARRRPTRISHGSTSRQQADAVFPTPCAHCRPECGPHCECTCHRAAAGARR
jgi:hypothetical protein